MFEDAESVSNAYTGFLCHTAYAGVSSHGKERLSIHRC